MRRRSVFGLDIDRGTHASGVLSRNDYCQPARQRRAYA
jgi:hypothetical protein